METTELKIICLQSEAFYSLIDCVVTHIRKEQNIKQDRWISGQEAMKILNISRSTLAEYRYRGLIRYSGTPRCLVYDKTSIELFLETNAKNTF